MKKVLVSVLALAALGGCASHYDYYKGGVQYTQDGADCIYYAGEKGNHYSNEIRGLDTSKKIVYRNTRCEDLYNRDMAGSAPRADRQILAPAANVAPVCNTCAARATYVAAPTCGTCAQPVVRRRYVIMPAM